MKLSSLLGGTALAFASCVTHAAYPDHPVRVMVGFSAGGPTDVVARAFADSAAKYLQQPFVVENKPGANTILAAGAVAGAKPDGYTLLFGAANHTMIPALYQAQVNFDALESFAPICSISNSPYVLVVGPSMPVKSLAEFLSLIKENPGVRTYASPGVGSSGHFAVERLLRQVGASMNHIPYKGASPAITDTMGGQVDSSLATLGSVLPQIQAGKLKALAVAAPARSSLMPEIPTFNEAGVKGFQADAWYGLLAPAGTPEQALVKLRDAAAHFSNDPESMEKLKSLGMAPQNLCGEDFANQLSREVSEYKELARELDLQNSQQ